MKKILLALSAIAIGTAAASAADLPARTYTAPLLPPPPVFSWTGFYVGECSKLLGSGCMSSKTSTSAGEDLKERAYYN